MFVTDLRAIAMRQAQVWEGALKLAAWDGSQPVPGEPYSFWTASMASYASSVTESRPSTSACHSASRVGRRNLRPARWYQ